MDSKRFKFIIAALTLLLVTQVLAPGRSAAAGKVIEQLPEPEWSYTLPDGYTFWNTLDSLQNKERMFIQLSKKVKLSASQTKYSDKVYASIDRKNGSTSWVYDFSDIANDKPSTPSKFYSASNGYSYFYKMKGAIAYDFSVVDPKGKLKWTKYITDSYTPLVLDSGNIVIRSYVPHKPTSITFTEYNQGGKQIRKLNLTNKWTSGILEVLPNGYVTHELPEQGSISVYRSLSALKTPLVTYTVPKSMKNPYFEVKSFKGGSFIVYLSSKNSKLVIGYDMKGKKKWVRTLNVNDQIDITGNNYLVRNENVYRLYSKDNQLLGKQQIGEIGDKNWIYHMTPSGEITVEKQYQWQERPSIIDENLFEGDWAREDFYVLDPGNLQIKYHLSTLWLDQKAGHMYIYAGNGELYLTNEFFDNTLTKYILK
ncbi:hypothetical protein ABEW19_28260 [Paenibacillus illinoisensis]|uniref:hypothetical protein n=1 Tax=Paenibacillus illinoisensis TaxID=59845 RepID=UPI000FD85574|nr:hypothetical protein [Paenibacillus illinoisensis]